jgi:transglutaminase-like putative cysteine protease
MPLSRSTPHNLTNDPTLGDVAGAMVKFAIAGRESLDVIGLTHTLFSGIQSGDYNSEINACYYWCCQNIRYQKDPVGVEYVQSPSRTIKERAGDCDDIATCLAAMLMACGHRVRFALVGFEQGAPSHVYVEVLTPSGWTTLDPVANRATANMLGDIVVKTNVAIPTNIGSRERERGAVSFPGSAAPAAGPAQIYSVYDYPTGVYHYYAGPLGEVPASGFHRKARNVLPEGLAVKLPPEAQPIGEGPAPQGIIATTGEFESFSTWSPLVLLGVAGVALFGLWRLHTYLSGARSNPVRYVKEQAQRLLLSSGKPSRRRKRSRNRSRR